MRKNLNKSKITSKSFFKMICFD